MLGFFCFRIKLNFNLAKERKQHKAKRSFSFSFGISWIKIMSEANNLATPTKAFRQKVYSAELELDFRIWTIKKSSTNTWNKIIILFIEPI